MKKILFAILIIAFLAGCVATPENTNLQGNDSNESTGMVIKNLTSNISMANETLVKNETGEEDSKYDFSPVYSEDGKLMVYFFYSRYCPASKAIGPHVESIGKKYENWTEWRGFDIYIQKDKERYLQFFKDFNISQNRSGVPTILVNRTVLWGRYEINDSLEGVINGSIIDMRG